MQSKVVKLAVVSVMACLKINLSKTKVMRANTRNAESVDMDEAEIDEIKHFSYLGGNISSDDGTG